MKFFTFATALLGALVTVTSALPTGDVSTNAPTGDPLSSPFYITSPLQGTVYTANTVETTTWLNGVSGRFKITVLKGTSPNAMYPTKYVYYADGTDSQYEWKVPEELVGGTYAFHYEYQNGDSYSGQFKVVTAKDAITPSPTTTSASPNASPTDANSSPSATKAPPAAAEANGSTPPAAAEANGSTPSAANESAPPSQ